MLFLKKQVLESRFSAVLVVLLFPGFYLYNAGLAASWYPPFFGGWFGPVAIVVGLPYLAMLAVTEFRKGRINLSWLDLIVLILVGYCVLWATIYLCWGDQNGWASLEYGYTLGFLFLWLVCFYSFKHFSYESSLIWWLLLFLWGGMFLIAVLNQKGSMYYAATENSNVVIATYQGFARSALVTSALVLCQLKGWKGSGIGVASLVLLFILGARTEFLGIVLVLFIYFTASRMSSGVKVLLMAVSILACVMLVFCFHEIVDGSRIDNLFKLAQDNSWQTRKSFSLHAWETIRSSWLFGGYASQFAYGDLGSYSHNALSAWVSFGLFGFLLFVSANLGCLVYLILTAFRGGLKVGGKEMFALTMAAYAVVCMVFAKNVGDPIFAVAWGATAAVAAGRKINAAHSDSRFC